LHYVIGGTADDNNDSVFVQASACDSFANARTATCHDNYMIFESKVHIVLL
jgi:hypothetical protein